MALYGAKELRHSRFWGGLVLDVDPTEIGDDQASDLLNVDLDGQTIRKRKGRVALNATAPTASPVLGLLRYYSRSGTGTWVMAAGTGIYADTNADGDFGDAGETLATWAGGPRVDLIQWRDTVYAGNGVDGLYRWPGSGSAAAVTALTAPAAAPALTPVQTQLEAFDTAAGYTVSDADLTVDTRTDVTRDGTAVKFTCTDTSARGATAERQFSAGATVDLSRYEELCVWVYGKETGLSFQIGVKNNSNTLDWKAFPTFNVAEAKTWVQYRVPLTGIPSASRTASTGWALRLVLDDNLTLPTAITLDDMQGAAPFVPDRYSYYYTYATADGEGSLVKESAPYTVSGSPTAGTLDVGTDTVLGGIQVGYAASGDSAVNKVLLYRYRDHGPFTRARRVAVLANGTGTYLDQRSDGELALANEPELQPYRMAPPAAYTYALVNHRLLAGDVTVSGTRHPWRLYLSRRGRPEEFASSQEPEEATAAGWIDLPDRDNIVRIVEFDGTALLFCTRSVWELAGSGWDDFTLKKRADAGLSAPEAVAKWGRAVFFLSADGVRALVPSEQADGKYRTWVLSEPVGSLLRSITAAYRSLCSMGIDERERLHVAIVRSSQTAPDATLVLDLHRPGALDPSPNPLRPGWTYNTSCPFRCFHSIRRGGAAGENGDLFAGDATTARLWRLHVNGAGDDVWTDNGSAITWHWQGKAWDAGAGRTLEWVYVTGEYDAASGQSVTLTPVLNGTPSGTTYTQSLGSALSGMVAPAEKRTAASIRGRYGAIKVGGAHSGAMGVRGVEIGVVVRG